MDRREFLAVSAVGAVELRMDRMPRSDATGTAGRAGTRKILIAGGGFGPPFIRYLAALTGRPRPKLLYLPTASADSDSSILGWYERCASLDVIPSAQKCFISSYSEGRSWEEILLSVDGIVVSGGNTLNQQAIWRAQGIDAVLRRAWDLGIVLGGASAGSLCWFDEGTTDSRPRELTIVKGLGFLKGSHSPHYDGEAVRRPVYRRLIASGEMQPGYACDNYAGIYFEDNEVRRVVASRRGAKVYRVGVVNGEVVEEVLDPEFIE